MNYSNIKIGATIIDNNGRKGVITEVRRKWVPATDGIGWTDGEEIECIFARPSAKKPVEDIAVGDVRGGLIMATVWHIDEGGTFRGLWADSPIGSELTATVEES